MSFLADPPLLFTTGAAVEAVVPDAKAKKVLGAVVVVGFVGFSVGLYLEKPWTAWLWKMVGARSGRDWMINSGVTHFEYDDPSIGTHLLSGAIFATYPAWFHLGRKLVRSLR